MCYNGNGNIAAGWIEETDRSIYGYIRVISADQCEDRQRIDRLGRDCVEVQNQRRILTKDKGADIVHPILSVVAENESSYRAATG